MIDDIEEAKEHDTVDDDTNQKYCKHHGVVTYLEIDQRDSFKALVRKLDGATKLAGPVNDQRYN